MRSAPGSTQRATRAEGDGQVTRQARRRRGRGRAAAGLLLGLALLGGGGAPAAALAQAPDAAADDTAATDAVRIVLVADVHSRHERLAQVVEAVRRERPALVLDAGDLVHDGTASEFRRAFAARAEAGVPWLAVRGNHDAKLRGPHAGPPPDFPEVEVVEHGALRIVLLDNEDGTIDEDTFARLESALAAGAGRPTLVVMHVPALVSRESALARLRHLLPIPLASPMMHVPEQVERFTGLMQRHGVLAVLSGHTHRADRVERGGVHYIVAGAAGGLRPGLGLPNEYAELTVRGREVELRRVTLAPPPRDPASFVWEAFRFYAGVNATNHADQGWNYVPSTAVQLGAAARRTERAGGRSTALEGIATFERLIGEAGRGALLADVSLSAGRDELAGHLALAARGRPLGDYNRGLHADAGLSLNAGVLGGGASAGIGLRVGAGAAWHHLSLQLDHTRATNHRATRLYLARRF